MNRTHVVAKAGLLLIGLYVIGIMLKGPSVKDYASPFGIDPKLMYNIIQYTFLLGFGVIAYQLLVCPDTWAAKIAGSAQNSTDENTYTFAKSIYRLSLVVGGIFCLYQVVPSITRFIFSQAGPPELRKYGLTIPDIIQIVGTGYLLCGAPQFCRWHVRKTDVYAISIRGKKDRY